MLAREKEREERERLREQRKVEQEMAREKERLEKERQHYTNALQVLLDKGDVGGAERPPLPAERVTPPPKRPLMPMIGRVLSPRMQWPSKGLDPSFPDPPHPAPGRRFHDVSTTSGARPSGVLRTGLPARRD